jgi:hypothetical protein
LADAQAYLLERMGDLVSALEILLKDLDVAIQQMIKFHQSAPPVAPTVPPISALSPRRGTTPHTTRCWPHSPASLAIVGREW